MEDIYIEESVRQRLILSGINELEEHGLADFSLRRAALGAQVSCAAPYRHFKSKEEYIYEIIKYVNSKWTLLATEINNIFKNDPSSLAIEMCIANLRFWIANRNYRTVFTVALDSGKTPEVEAMLDYAVLCAVEQYSKYRNFTKEECELKKYTVRALIAGSVMLVGSGDGDDILFNARKKLEFEFPV